MNTIKSLLGIKSSSQKALEASQLQAQQAQIRASNAAMEDAAVTRAQQVSGRQMRGAGRRALAFMGSELGVQSPLAATGPV